MIIIAPDSAIAGPGATVASLVGKPYLIKTAWAKFSGNVATLTSLSLNVPTFDDNVVRFVTGVWLSDATALSRLQLLSSGRTMFDQDCGQFSATYGKIGCFVPVKQNVVLQAVINNQSTVTITAPSITVEYTIYDNSLVL